MLQEGLTPAPAAVKRGSFPLVGEVDWTAMCTVAHRCRIAPIVYQCLRASALPVPRDVMDWFRVQHYETVARNLASLSELDAVLKAFAAGAIPAIVFKGPALAHFGNEMARSWQDLDILIHTGAVDQVESVLLKAGYPLIPGPVHRNHRRYAGAGNTHRGVLEIHFNISDPLRSHRPDVQAIWDRSAEMKILGVSARVPELTDHLLLTIMQLPHHHWSVRLLVDILHVVSRWQSEIDWDGLFRRAASWQMIALTRTALWVLITRFGASVPREVVSRVQPAGYYDRFHRGIADQAIDEQLAYPFRAQMLWIAPFVVVDRPGQVPAILLRRLLFGSGPSEEGKVERAFHRNMTTLAALPAVVRLLINSLRPSPGNGGMAPR
ncbi:MAG TPA: nucleotidyltransferase family protein [bacterium]